MNTSTSRGQRETPERELRGDFEWAVERVTRMCASALVDAQVYRTKLLKGFGYPNEVFRAAQDYRALRIVLSTLASSGAAPQEPRLRALFDEVYERGHWDWPTQDTSRADKRRLAVDEAMARLAADAEASAIALRAAQEKES